ncbi:MAG: TetR/AcrR family transcriptional regulator [Synergistaceae bacterium]|nr:TetR/AcrR family transcriptional regulator [Synergistaceae bacterium]
MNGKERLIQAAVEEIKVRSLHFTMDDLTRRLRVSKSSLYKAVSSKDEVVSGVIGWLIDSFNSKESEILKSDIPILGKLKMFTEAFMSVTQGFSSDMYGDLKRYYPEEWERWTAFREEKVGVFMSILQEGINDGVLRPVNSAVVYQCLSASMTAIASPEFLASNSLTYAQAVDTLQDIVFNGLTS